MEECDDYADAFRFWKQVQIKKKINTPVKEMLYEMDIIDEDGNILENEI